MVTYHVPDIRFLLHGFHTPGHLPTLQGWAKGALLGHSKARLPCVLWWGHRLN